MQNLHQSTHLQAVHTTEIKGKSENITAPLIAASFFFYKDGNEFSIAVYIFPKCIPLCICIPVM
jgi:hypothetical protein